MDLYLSVSNCPFVGQSCELTMTTAEELAQSDSDEAPEEVAFSETKERVFTVTKQENEAQQKRKRQNKARDELYKQQKVGVCFSHGAIFFLFSFMRHIIIPYTGSGHVDCSLVNREALWMLKNNP